MEAIHLRELKARSMPDLVQMAKDLNIEGAAGLRKQELIFALLQAHAARRGDVYADGVLEFDLAQFEILPYRGDESSTRTIVRTTVKLDDGTKVPVDYGLVKHDSGWQLFDVTIEGISYIRNFRAEFNSEIQATGLDAVIARLQREAGKGENADTVPGDDDAGEQEEEQ